MQKILKKLNSVKFKQDAGMTFVELTVVITIIGIMAGVIFFNYGTFNSGISLQNTAQEVALAVEQAQRYATSGTTLGQSTANYRPTYGVYFNLDSNSDFDNKNTTDPQKQFVLFNDIIGADRIFTSKCAGVECVDNLSISTGDYISKICFDTNITKTDCYDKSTSKPVNISFQRPFPDAYIDDGNSTIRDNVSIEITSKDGKQIRDIVVWKTGQVEVVNPN